METDGGELIPSLAFISSAPRTPCMLPDEHSANAMANLISASVAGTGEPTAPLAKWTKPLL